jgi:hypothetical protein
MSTSTSTLTLSGGGDNDDNDDDDDCARSWGKRFFSNLRSENKVIAILMQLTRESKIAISLTGECKTTIFSSILVIVFRQRKGILVMIFEQHTEMGYS